MADPLTGVIEIKDKVSKQLRNIEKNVLRLNGKMASQQEKIRQQMKKTESTSKVSSDNIVTNLRRIGTTGVFDSLAQKSTMAFVKMKQSAFKQIGAIVRKIHDIPNAAHKARKGIATMGAGAANIRGGAMNLAMAGSPFTVGGALIGKTFVDFEAQMAIVKSIAQDDFIDKYTEKARELGRTTQFTATEAGKAMEVFARAGIKGVKMLEAIGPALHMAAANGLELAGSADIMIQAMTNFGFTTEKEMKKVTDFFSYTASNTNSSMEELAEAMKYSVGNATKMKMSFEELVIVLGKLHDFGLKGSMAGTALNQMLEKLAAPTKKAQDAMKLIGFSAYTKTGEAKDIFSIIQELQAKTQGMSDKDRNAILSAVSGIRGGRALDKFSKLIDTDIDEMRKLTTGQIDVTGTAAKMAKDRLDSTRGSLTLLRSALEEFAISVGGIFKKSFAEGTLRSFVDVFQVFVQHFVKYGDAIEQGLPATVAFIRAFAGLSEVSDNADTLAAVIAGIHQGIGVLTSMINWFVNLIKEGSQEFSAWLGPEAVKNLTSIAVVFGGIMAVVTPIILGMAGLGLVIMGLVPIVKGVVAIVGGALGMISWPLVAAAGVIFLILEALRGEGESYTDAAVKAWHIIANTAIWAWDHVIKPLVMGFWDTFSETFWRVAELGGAIFAALGSMVEDFSLIFHGEGENLAIMWHWVGKTIAGVIDFLVTVPLAMFKAAIEFASDAFSDLVDMIRLLGSGEIKATLMKFAGMLARSLFLPVRMFMDGMAEIFRVIGQEEIATNINTQMEQWREAVNKIGDTEASLKLKAEREERRAKAMAGIGDEAESPLDQITKEQAVAGATMEQKIRAFFEGRDGKQDDILNQLSEINNKTGRDKETKVNVKIGSKSVAKATAKHKNRLKDKIGAANPPLFRRVAAQQGL